MAKKFKLISILAFCTVFLTTVSQASHISGIRITQTGNTGLEINVDITAFYTTGSTESEANLGTYYNQIPAADWGDGSTLERYGNGPSTGIPLVATSTVVNGITARAYRGSFSHTYGSAGNYTIEANTGCCPLTTPTYTLVTGTILTETISTTGPFGPTTFTTSFVQNTLNVNAEAPVFSKGFVPASVAINSPSTLTFTIDNTASTLDDNVLDFTDNLPAGMVVATPANVVNTCGGGTVTATSGDAVISYTGGVVPAGVTCSVSVDVTVTQAGSFVNTTGDLTSAFGNSGTASDTLIGFDAPAFSKVFAPSTVAINTPSTLTFTIDNSANPVDATTLDFTDNLPANMTVATPGNATTTCTGGTLTATDGSNTISYTGGTASSASSCTVSVDVVVSQAGDFVNVSEDLTSNLGNSGTATDTLTGFDVPVFSKDFAAASVSVNTPIAMTLTVDNTANTIAASSLDFTDNLPAGMEVASPVNSSTTCTGGTVTAVAAATSVMYTGGTVNAASTCTVSVDVIVTLEGSFTNTTGDLTSSLGNSGPASDTLLGSSAPLFSKEFSPANVPLNSPSTLTFTIDNTANTVAANMLDFTDNLPTNMETVGPANVSLTCTGGNLTSSPGATSISYSGGGMVGAGASCTISVDVIVTQEGSFVNTTGDLTSSLGNSGTATDTLVGTSAPDFSKVFNPSDVAIDSPATLTLTIDNNANAIEAESLALTDNLPPGMEVANPANASTTCIGGTLTASAGATSIEYTGGEVSASASCIVSVDVIVTQSGVFNNTTEDLISSLGNSGMASDTLTSFSSPLFSKAFSPDEINAVEDNGLIESTLTFTIDNTANPVDATDLEFVDNMPTGMTVNDPANIINNCVGGTVSAVSGDGVISYTGGTVLANAVCTISVDVVLDGFGTFNNDAGILNSSLGSSAPNSAIGSIIVGVVRAIPTISIYGLSLLMLLLAYMTFKKIRRSHISEQ